MAITHQQEIREALRAIYVRYQKTADRILAPYGLSLAKYSLLIHIAENSGVRSADVIKAFTLAPRTVTEAIDGLESDGLIQRHADSSDRRVKVLALTAFGIKLYRKVTPIMERFGESLFGVLTAPERKQLSRMLGKLADRIDDLHREAEASSNFEKTIMP